MKYYTRQCERCLKNITVLDAPDCSSHTVFRDFRIYHEWTEKCNGMSESDIDALDLGFDVICDRCEKKLFNHKRIEDHDGRNYWTSTGYIEDRYEDFRRQAAHLGVEVDCDNETGSGVSGTWKYDGDHGTFSLCDAEISKLGPRTCDITAPEVIGNARTWDAPYITDIFISVDNFMDTERQAMLEFACKGDDSQICAAAEKFAYVIRLLTSIEWGD